MKNKNSSTHFAINKKTNKILESWNYDGYDHNELKNHKHEYFTKDVKRNFPFLNENDIVVGCKNVPNIWYNDKNGKKHRHYVDIFIPSQNKCIEVKSTWTEKININNIFLKQNAGKQLGFNYEIWIYDSKGNKVNSYK